MSVESAGIAYANDGFVEVLLSSPFTTHGYAIYFLSHKVLR